jgi:arylsulfatase A-like enzyme/Tfp pilus assembly protein PilF
MDGSASRLGILEIGEMRNEVKSGVRPARSNLAGKILRRTIVACFLCAALPSIANDDPASTPVSNIILISIDTLRADHLGAYGYRKSVTPNLDQLAREGIVYEHAYTPVPLTLPAHTALLTGEYPPKNGVRDNGEALLASVPTLAERLRENGLNTTAFVGAFVLDRRFGLARGFENYWGDFQLFRYPGKDPGMIQIRGDRVEAAAEEWITAHHSDRFFAFVHFYDLHGPYLLPEPWLSRFGDDVYDGELAYTDDLIGRLWKSLQKLGLADRTALIITADHGEGLGDHGERHHGFFLYNSTINIPMIVRMPGGASGGTRIQNVARLIDIAPTICSLLGVPPLPTFQGHSLIANGEDKTISPEPAYSETLYPYRHFHTAPLYAVETERYSFISAPRRELYDLNLDPKQTHNLAPTAASLANRLQNDLKQIASEQAPQTAAQMSPEAMKALNSLGYVGSTSSASLPVDTAHLPDPKERIRLFGRYQDALAMGNEGNLHDSAIELERIASLDPALINVQIDAGLARRNLQQEASALPHFKAATRADPSNALAHFHLGVSLSNLHRDREAMQEFFLATKLEPWFSQAYTAQGLAAARLQDMTFAKASFDRAIQLDPDDFDALLNRGKLLTISSRWPDARQDLERAASLNPDSRAVHQALGTLAFYQGDLNSALEEYQRALQLEDSDASIHANLALLYERLGEPQKARTEFQRSLKLDPTNQESIDGLRRMP